MKKQMNILLIIPTFYDLGKVVENELLDKGYKVTVIESKIFKEDFLLLKTFLSFFYFFLNPFYKMRYTIKVINKINNKKFDILFTVGYLSTTTRLFKQLKSENANIKTILYLWDSFAAWDFSFLLDYFEYKYSFDREDCKKYASKKLVYLPLFYNFVNEQKNVVYDITHIGTLNKHYNSRMIILDAVIRQANDLGLHTYIRTFAASLNRSFFKRKKILSFIRDRLQYLFDSEFRNYIIALRKNKDKGFIFDSSLNQDIFYLIESQSKCILDINVDVNTGVSHRVIRAIAMGKKVITTNKYIENEDFYSSKNISIIDKVNPVIDINFLNTTNEKVDISYLRIDNWINKIFMDVGVIS